MRSLEEFFHDQSKRPFNNPTRTPAAEKSLSELRSELRQSANRGFEIFPVSEIAKLTGQPEQLLDEATSDINRLEELAAELSICSWRVALGPSNLCVLRVEGAQGRASLIELSQQEDDCLSLRAQRADTVWVFFRHPAGLELRPSARKLAPGLSVLAGRESCSIPPSGGSEWLNPWADIEAVPYWLRELAFESPITPPGKAVLPRMPTPPFVPCRSTQRIERRQRCVRRGYPSFNQGGWDRGFRPSRRR